MRSEQRCSWWITIKSIDCVNDNVIRPRSFLNSWVRSENYSPKQVYLDTGKWKWCNIFIVVWSASDFYQVLSFLLRNKTARKFGRTSCVGISDDLAAHSILLLLRRKISKAYIARITSAKTRCREFSMPYWIRNTGFPCFWSQRFNLDCTFWAVSRLPDDAHCSLSSLDPLFIVYWLLVHNHLQLRDRKFGFCFFLLQ